MMQGIKDILDALKQLQSTIYLACDEKPADDISKIVRDAVAEITSLRAELEKAKKDGWISVKDRMPENVHIEHLTVGHSKAVLGYVKDNLCTFCVSYDYEHKAWRYFCDSNHIVRHEITHWQPLPEPPKE